MPQISDSDFLVISFSRIKRRNGIANVDSDSEFLSVGQSDRVPADGATLRTYETTEISCR